MLCQSFKDFELLIVDDGSTDGSSTVVQSFSDSRIRVLENSTRLKLSGALNRGIEEAKGKYIARMDADDISLPHRLQKQVDFLDNHPAVVMCGTAIEIFGEKEQTRIDIYPAAAEQINTYMLFDCPFCHPSVMIRREIFDKKGLRYNGNFYPTEDYELWARVAASFPTANLSDVLLRYRVHGESMTGADWNEMDRQATRIIRNLLNTWGVQFTENELQMHRNIGRGRSCRLKNENELDNAGVWLHKLITVNNEKTVYDKLALAETISLIWYRLCVNNTFFGLNVFKKYISSSLIKVDPIKKEHVSVLLLSVLKNALIAKRCL